MRGLMTVGALVAVCGLLQGCSAAPTATPLPSGSVAPAGFVCAQPDVSPLPDWARAGFTPPDQAVGHLLSVERHIVAVPFGWPLREKQPEGRSNKILWVADRDDGGPLSIDARRQSDTETVHRDVADGPGPSIIDLPAPGCWQLDLSWPGGRDRIYLEYLGPAG